VADLTYIRLELEFVYLAVLLDAFSRRVIGYSSAGCTPAVKHQTTGLDKTVRNKDRVGWSRPFGGGKLRPRAHWCYHKPVLQCGPGSCDQIRDDAESRDSSEVSTISFRRILACTARAVAFVNNCEKWWNWFVFSTGFIIISDRLTSVMTGG
jgi:hypothetical protein